LTGSTLKLAALIVPLGLDTLGVALALGTAGVLPRQRTRIAFLFAGFEAAMPLVGVAIGAPLGRAIGSAADYGAAALILALSAYLLIVRDDDDGDRLPSLTNGGLLGALVLGMSVSLDELASVHHHASWSAHRRASQWRMQGGHREACRSSAHRTWRAPAHRASS
jgi:manganese efflux pump family protein